MSEEKKNESCATGADNGMDKVSANAWVIAGSILLSALLIAGGNYHMSKGGVTAAAPAAAAPAAAAPAAAAPAAAAAAPTVTKDAIKNLWKNDAVVKMGNADAKVLLVEISDPSCPFCQIASGGDPEYNKTISGGKFKLVADGGTYVSPVQEFKKLALSGQASYAWMYKTGHGNGKIAAEILYCSNEQGKFWEAHDALTSKEGYNTVENVVKNDRAQSNKLVALLAGVDKGAVQKCVDDKKHEATVTAAEALAGTLGVRGTPGFFVNQKNYAGAYSYTDIKPEVDAALK